MAKYIISYTSDNLSELDQDFILVEIRAHNYTDAMLIVSNIEKYFDGVTIECVEEETKSPKHKRRINSDRRKSS